MISIIKKLKHKRSYLFIKAQISSIISTTSDWAVTILLTDVMKMWYGTATFSGAIVGGITNFSINKRWVFKSTTNNVKIELYRYIIIWTCSILLNTTGTIFLTEIVKLNYRLAKITTSILVAIYFNYLMQKKFVFHT